MTLSVGASIAISESVLDSNGCVRKWNTTIAGSDGRHPEGEVKSLLGCSEACTKEPPCEAFLYHEEGRNCTLFSGAEILAEQSGNGTVGYCLPGKFCGEFGTTICFLLH